MLAHQTNSRVVRARLPSWILSRLSPLRSSNEIREGYLKSKEDLHEDASISQRPTHDSTQMTNAPRMARFLNPNTYPIIHRKGTLERIGGLSSSCSL